MCHLWCPFGVNSFLNKSAATHLLLLSSFSANVGLCSRQELQDDAPRSNARQMGAILRRLSECVCTSTVCVSKQEVSFFDAQASLAPTHVSLSVRGRLVIHLNFHSINVFDLKKVDPKYFLTLGQVGVSWGRWGRFQLFQFLSPQVKLSKLIYFE